MFVIDVMSRVPVYEQLINQVEEQILTGLLNSGDKMPSVRSLSVSLSINPNTIQKAYTELDRMKLIITVPGKGSFVSSEALNICEPVQGKRCRNSSRLSRNWLLPE